MCPKKEYIIDLWEEGSIASEDGKAIRRIVGNVLQHLSGFDGIRIFNAAKPKRPDNINKDQPDNNDKKARKAERTINGSK